MDTVMKNQVEILSLKDGVINVQSWSFGSEVQEGDAVRS